MERVAVQGYVGSWDPETRVARFARNPGAARRADIAQDLAGAIAKWVGQHEPFVLLLDCAHTESATLIWRLEWADVFRRFGARVQLAAYHLDHRLQADLDAFSIQAAVRIHVFPNQDEAEAWALRASRTSKT